MFGRALRLQLLYTSAHASNCISTYGIQCCGHCKIERYAEPVACTRQHPPSHYLLSTTTTKHPLSINAALPNISMDIVQGLARYPTRFAVQGAAPATLLHEFSCNQILQYEIWCCSHCNSEQHAEPFACIRSSFSSGALRLQPGMFFTCVSVVLGFHGGVAVMPYSFKFLAGLQAVVETCRKQQRSKELFSRCAGHMRISEQQCEGRPGAAWQGTRGRERLWTEIQERPRKD